MAFLFIEAFQLSLRFHTLSIIHKYTFRAAQNDHLSVSFTPSHSLLLIGTQTHIPFLALSLAFVLALSGFPYNIACWLGDFREWNSLTFWGKLLWFEEAFCCKSCCWDLMRIVFSTTPKIPKTVACFLFVVCWKISFIMFCVGSFTQIESN